MNHLLKRPLSLIMAILMVLSLIPATPVHVHAAGPAVTIDNGLTVMTGQSYDTGFQAYPVKKNAIFAVKLTNRETFEQDGYDKQITVEVEYLLSSASTSSITIKEDFQFQYGAAGTTLENAAASYYKPGNTTKSRIAVYELSGAELAGNYSSNARGIAVMLKNTTDAYVGICSIKITKGIDNIPIQITGTTGNYHVGQIPVIEVKNPSTFDKVVVLNYVIKNESGVEIGNPVADGNILAHDGTKTAISADYLNRNLVTPGVYTITFTGYWNRSGNTINLEYQYTVKDGHTWDAQSDGTETGHTATCTNIGCTAVCNTDNQNFDYKELESPDYGHNHKAICEVCGFSSAVVCVNSGDWTFNGNGQHTSICEDCGATMTRECTPDVWKPVANGCSQKCKVCDGVLESREEHTWLNEGEYQDNGDGKHQRVCSACNYTDVQPHTYTYDEVGNGECMCGAIDYCEHNLDWKFEGKKHWQFCTKCTFKTAEKDHNSDSPYKHNKNQHWQECVCGQTTKPEDHNKVKHPYKDATCTEDGNQECSYCSTCGTFFDANGDETTRDKVIISKKGHDYQTVGVLEGHYQKCSRCDSIIERKQHVVDWKPVAGAGKHAGTCSVCQYELEEAHRYDVTNVTKQATCTEEGEETATCKCEDKLTRPITALGHKPGEKATCTTDQTCTRPDCNHIIQEALGHDFSGDKGACSREGCNATACDEDHAKVVVDEAVLPTCKTTGLTEGKHCSVCGEVIVKQEIVPVTDHTPGTAVKENEIPASCGANGSYDKVVYCSACKQELSREPQTVIATGEHVYATEKEKVDATCTADGYVIMACGCGATETQTINQKGHTPAEAVVENNVAATCTNDGSYDNVVYCSDCNKELSRKTVTVTAPGHTPAEAVKENENPATCTNDGSYDNVVYCSVCNGEISRNTVTVDALGHNYENARWETDDTNHWKTCTNDGCNEKESNEAHSLGQYKADNKVHWKECDICGFTTTKGEHTLEPDWNNRQHWQYCTECGEKGSYGNHKDTNPWVEVDDETHSRICTGCPYTQTAPHDNDKAECVCGHKAAARIGETYYPTLTKALAAAKNGATVTLLADQTADVLSIDPGVTLNLNGKTVKARQVTSFGDIIDSSEDNTGRLNIEDRKSSLIQKGNDQLPVKTKTGFVFVEVKNFNQKVKDAEAKYIFQPLFEEDAHDLLLADLEDTGVSIIVRVSWKYKGEAATHDFVFSDELVKAYIASYSEKTEGRYGKQFALRLIGTEQVTDLTFTAVVHSAGVEITSQVMSCPSNAEEAPSN